jgi:ABC-type uncharacterized transport system involved in gliding motility auxiliary subunit
MERKQRAATLSWVFLAILAAGLVLVNALGHMTNKRIDATKNEQFTLSQGSARLVREGLKENMTITLYVTRGLPKIELFVEDLVNLLGEYKDASNGKLSFVVIEPTTPELEKEAEDAGLQKFAFGEGSETGDSTTIAQGFMGMVFEYGTEKDVIPALMPGQFDYGLEFQITTKIRQIKDKADNTKPKVGLVQKPGLKLSDSNLMPAQGGQQGPSVRQVIDQYFPFYDFSDVDLEGGEVAIDADLGGIIVLQASEDWTDKELARIDEFLMRGNKALLVIAGAAGMKAADASMKATLSTHGIERLTQGYGIGINKDVVLDLTALPRLPVPTRTGQAQYIPAYGILQLGAEDDVEGDEEKPQIDNSFAGFFRLEQLAFPYPSSLTVTPEKQPDAEVKIVARSSEKAWKDTGGAIEGGPASVDLALKNLERVKPTGETGSFPIAAYVDGKLKSALVNNEALTKPEGLEIPTESAAPSRVFVLASPLFVVNPYAHAGNPPPMPPQMAMMGAMGGDRMLQMIAGPYTQAYLATNVVAFQHMLDWLTGDTALLAVSSKLISASSLSYKDVPKPDINAEDSEETVKQKLQEYREGRKKLQQRVQLTLIFVPSLAFLALGIFRWRRREANRSRIKI